jgi:hypothetical protein
MRPRGGLPVQSLRKDDSRAVGELGASLEVRVRRVREAGRSRSMVAGGVATGGGAACLTAPRKRAPAP